MLLRLGSLRIFALAAAVCGGLVACDRMWPSNETASAGKGAKTASAPLPAPRPAEAPAQVASLPPAAPAPVAPPSPPSRMSADQEANFNAWVVKTYLGCWKPAAAPSDSDPYVAHVRLVFKPDGSLSKKPKLVNPPSDPALKAQAKSVMAAVKACDPLQVPAQYRPFYDQWKTRTIHFDPQVAAR